jgi:hypothetical protein
MPIASLLMEEHEERIRKKAAKNAKITLFVFIFYQPEINIQNITKKIVFQL